MKIFAYACVLLAPLATVAAAETRMEGLAPYSLVACGGPQVYLPAGVPGPIPPRVQSPADAAPWLASRDWDVRPFRECVTASAPKLKTKAAAAPVKRRAHQIPIK